jgi:hypothetical protein
MNRQLNKQYNKRLKIAVRAKACAVVCSVSRECVLRMHVIRVSKGSFRALVLARVLGKR